jgi:two-component system chemotaxis sensor kinase CheA
LLDLELRRDSDAAIERVFRAGHTLRGIGGVIGWIEFMRLTHALESVLDHLRTGALAATDELIGAVYAGTDSVKRMVSFGNETSEALAGYGAALNRLRALEPPLIATALPDVPALYEVSLRFRPDIVALSEDTKLLLDQLGLMGELVSVEPLNELAVELLQSAPTPPGLRVLLRTSESELAIKGVCIYSADEDQLKITRLAEPCRNASERENAHSRSERD